MDECYECPFWDEDNDICTCPDWDKAFHCPKSIFLKGETKNVQD